MYILAFIALEALQWRLGISPGGWRVFCVCVIRADVVRRLFFFCQPQPCRVMLFMLLFGDVRNCFGPEDVFD